MNKTLLLAFILILVLFNTSSSTYAQKIAKKDLFILSSAERALFNPPSWWDGTWSGYEGPALKNLHEAFDQGKPVVPLGAPGPEASWYDPDGKGSQNHSLLWLGVAALGNAMNGNVAAYDTAAVYCLKLLDLNWKQGHMRHEALGQYAGFWSGGIACMALAGLYAPPNSAYGTQLLKEARKWWHDHITCMRALSFPDGQVGLVGARLPGKPGTNEAWMSLSAAVTLQLTDPQPHNTLHPNIASLITANGEPGPPAKGSMVDWARPRSVAERWVVLRAVQSGAITPPPANYPSPSVLQKIYRWQTGNRLHNATPEIYGYREVRWHVSWAPGEVILIEEGDDYGVKGGKGPHKAPSSLTIPSTAKQILGPTNGLSTNSGSSVVPCQTCSNDAAFASQNVPATMEVGKSAKVSITMKNNGTITWTNSNTNGHKLGSENPQDNNTWGTNRVLLPVTSVAPGGQVTFNFTITAPSTPGTYNFQWRMVHEGKEWFGSKSNNVQIKVFSPDQDDASVLAVIEPFKKGCATDFVPKVSIRNEGPALLKEITLNYRIDNGPVKNKTFTSSTGVPVGETANLPLDNLSLTAGNHQIKIWSSNPNKFADINPSNDTISDSFEINASGIVAVNNYREDFETTKANDIPSDWTSYNKDGKFGWFVFDDNGNKTLAMHNFAYTGAVNAKDEIVMPLMDLTSYGKAWLTFDLAHASRSTATVYDSLEVLISTDCGATFTQVWAKGGKDLNTASDNDQIFTPAGPQDYRTEIVDLSKHNTADKVIIKFVNWSNNGNSTLIDNIQIASGAGLSIEEQNIRKFQIYPNPAESFVNIRLSDNLDIALVKIFDAIGNLLFATNAYGNIKVPLNNYPKGVYFIQVFVEGKTMASERLVIVR